jgi:TolB-like protein
MTKVISMLVITAVLITFFGVYAQTETIAILDFSNNCILEKDKYASLSPGLAEIMITELNAIKTLKFVERQKINELIQEMQLAQSGLVSEETGVQVGKLIGAKYLIFGAYMVFDKKIRIDVRIVEVETGITVKAEQATNKVKKMFDIIKELNGKILKDLDIKLTKNDKKILNADETSTEVIELFSQGLEFEDDGNIEKAKQLYKKAFMLDKNFKPVRKRLKAILLKEKVGNK